jgi:hypothetical protein
LGKNPLGFQGPADFSILDVSKPQKRGINKMRDQEMVFHRNQKHKVVKVVKK